jgi:hypothetical protein
MHACVKGPFHDAMQAKLERLNRSRSNEFISLDFDRIAGEILLQNSTNRHLSSPDRQMLKTWMNALGRRTRQGVT